MRSEPNLHFNCNIEQGHKQFVSQSAYREHGMYHSLISHEMANGHGHILSHGHYPPEYDIKGYNGWPEYPDVSKLDIHCKVTGDTHDRLWAEERERIRLEEKRYWQEMAEAERAEERKKAKLARQKEKRAKAKEERKATKKIIKETKKKPKRIIEEFNHKVEVQRKDPEPIPEYRPIERPEPIEKHTPRPEPFFKIERLTNIEERIKKRTQRYADIEYQGGLDRIVLNKPRFWSAETVSISNKNKKWKDELNDLTRNWKFGSLVED